MCSFIHQHCRYLLSWPRRFFGDERGVLVVLVALAMPVLVGTMGLAAEASYWYVHKRGMQNAADAAAIAAATNASSNYAAEAKAVATQYGFQNGSGNIAVTATNPNTATGCTTPAGSPASCYVVTVSDKVPFFLSKVIGYAGTTTVGGQGMTAMAATSVAMIKGAYPYCVLALANFPLLGPVVGITGALGPNLNGCNVMSDSNAICLLTNLNANAGDAHGLNIGCGNVQRANVPTVADPYAGLASNIPANPCGGIYPQEPIVILGILVGPALPALNKWTGSKSWSGNNIICGDLQLTGNTTIDASPNAVLVIYNGKLDLNNKTLQTSSGSGLTVVFAGTNSLLPLFQHSVFGSGTLDIAAPITGPWSGIAVYQAPNLTLGVDLTAAVLGATWDISGMVYFPNSVVASIGAINKATNGPRCFGMVVGTVAFALGASIFPNNNQCSSFVGLSQPNGGSRGTLVN